MRGSCRARGRSRRGAVRPAFVHPMLVRLRFSMPVEQAMTQGGTASSTDRLAPNSWVTLVPLCLALGHPRSPSLVLIPAHCLSRPAW